MDGGDSGESSCKKHSHDDSPSDNSRPFKKAKFPWQVKGKFHLKDQEEMTMEDEILQMDQIEQNNTDDQNKIEKETKEDESSFDDKVEDKLEMLSDYLLKQDCNNIDTMLFESDLDRQSSKGLIETPQQEQSSSLTYPKYTPSFKKVPSDNNNSSVDNNLDVSMSSNDATNSNTQSSSSSSTARQRSSSIEDQYLKRWQARQIAKGYVDNTINRVLDSWFVSPLPPYLDDDRHLSLEVTGLLDDLASNDGIENEGILMAISAHGLQNNQSNISHGGCPLLNFRLAENNNYSRTYNGSRHRILSNPTINDGHMGVLMNLPGIIVDELEGLPPQSSSSSSSTSRNVNPSNEIDRNSNVRSKTTTTTSSTPINPLRPFSRGCNCPNLHRRTNTNNPVTNVPFHMRSNMQSASFQSHSHSTDLAESENMPDISNNERTADESKDKEESDKKENESMEDDEDKTEQEQETRETSTSQSNDGQFEEHFDFIDAAVSYAIQAKGLIPF